MTAIDDGTIAGSWGMVNVDDEGLPGQRTVLIEDGVLNSFMVDRVGEIKTGFKRTELHVRARQSHAQHVHRQGQQNARRPD